MARKPKSPATANSEAPQTPPAQAGSVSAAVAAVMVVRVTGPVRGRWRAGRQFGPEPTDIAADALSEADIAALAGDPALRVEMVEIVAAPAT